MCVLHGQARQGSAAPPPTRPVPRHGGAGVAVEQWQQHAQRALGDAAVPPMQRRLFGS